MNYGLYQTLNQSIPECNISDNKKRRLIRRLKKGNEEQKEAVLLLICEHARIYDGYKYDPDNISLPYGLNETDKGLEFDLESLPIKLQHILKKFADMMHNNKKHAKSNT